MSTELTTTSELDSEWRYAQALISQPERGATSLLPKAYQGNTSNVLIAMGLGKAIGITPAQSLYEIYVVNGRPSPSANLMAALVRRAGHRLRIKGDATTCTATLIRHDDPDEPFEATWTFEQARAAGLTGKDTWKSYPAAMLRARAIAEVVRMGASEAVLGMEYAREEMQDVEPERAPAPARPTGMEGLRAAVNPEPVDAEVVEAVAEERADTQPEQPTKAADDWPNDLTDGTRKRMFALFGKAGIDDRAEQIKGIVRVIGRPIESRADLTEDEARKVIIDLETFIAAQSGEQG